jgi:hypothetical protein
VPIEVGWRPGQRVERAAVRERTDPVPDRLRIWTILAVAVILMISLARVPHLNFPLERDEGEFGYIAQQLLHGVPVYESGYTQKLPGSYYMYAIFLALFGQSIVAIHFGLLLVNAAIMGLIFLTLRRTYGGLAGVMGALVFGFMAMSPTLLGFAAHATFFVGLFSMSGLYLFLLARDRGASRLYLASGLSFGIAFLMKQPAAFFTPIMLGAWVLHAWAQPKPPTGLARHTTAFVAGSLLPVLLTVAYYAAIGRFALFWFWSVQFAKEFVGHVRLENGLMNFYDKTRLIISSFEAFWMMAFLGFLVMVREAVLGRERYPYLAFGLASLLSIVPGFYFSAHYYVSLLPFVALLVGSLMGAVRGRTGIVVVGTAIAIGLLIGFARFERYFTRRVPDSVASRAVYPGNPFAESIEIGNYLRSHTAPGDSIAILGSETQIYFYAQRPSASRFVNVYYLTANHPRNREMQHEMIRDIERVRPVYLVVVYNRFSWGMLGTSPVDILDWCDRYRRNYRVEGIVQMQGTGSVSTWGPEASAVRPTKRYIEILRRIDDSPTARTAGGVVAS